MLRNFLFNVFQNIFEIFTLCFIWIRFLGLYLLIIISSLSLKLEKGKKSKPRMVNRKRHSTPEKSGSSEREGSPAQKGGTKSPGRSRSGSRKFSGSFSGKKNDLRARYWSYLFDNLKRAVDEIYGTCEADESIVECQVLYMPQQFICSLVFTNCLKLLRCLWRFRFN